jgi:MSHA biogenesis protein MshL
MKQKKKLMKATCFTGLWLLLLGCQSVPTKPTQVNDVLDKAIAQADKKVAPVALAEIPNAIQQELMQNDMLQAKKGLLAEKRLSIAASQIDAQVFFGALIEDSTYSIAIHPEVMGKITLNLKNVTLFETLDVIEELYGFDIRITDKVIQVYPRGIRTETIPLDYLFVKRFGSSSTTINSGGVSDQESNGGGGSNNRGNNNSSNNNNNNNNSNNNNGGSNNQGGQGNQNSSGGINIYTEHESDFWTGLKDSLVSLIGGEEGRSVIVSPQAGLVTVRAYPNEIHAVKTFIQQTEMHLRRQVIIEAKIMEVTLNDDYQQGVEWSNVLGHIESTDVDFTTSGNIVGNAISASIGGVTGITFKNADFTNVIKLLSTQGNVQVLSSPRITATNNQKAVIKVGGDEYFVTDISNTTTTGTATTSTPDVELTPFFSGIALDVTPQINANGEVILHVHPSVTLTAEQTKIIRIGDDDYTLPLAQSTVRESDTIIKAKSGEIVIIGGLIENRQVELESKTPLLGDIPLLGELFKSKSKTSQKKELIIMLKPIVVGQDTWKDQLQNARALLKQWFPEQEK